MRLLVLFIVLPSCLSSCSDCCSPGGDCRAAYKGGEGVCCGEGRCCPRGAKCMHCGEWRCGYGRESCPYSSFHSGAVWQTISSVCLLLFLFASIRYCFLSPTHTSPPLLASPSLPPFSGVYPVPGAGMGTAGAAAMGFVAGAMVEEAISGSGCDGGGEGFETDV